MRICQDIHVRNHYVEPTKVAFVATTNMFKIIERLATKSLLLNFLLQSIKRTYILNFVTTASYLQMDTDENYLNLHYLYSLRIL